MSISIKDTLEFTENPKKFLADFNAKNTMLFVDENVFTHHQDMFSGFPIEIIPSGEHQKCFEVVERLLQKLLDAGIDRKGTLIGIGGGVVTDLSGFVSSIYLRGINFGFLPTTLLAMCDAAIGGKNGINFGSYKNMVGVINQPQFIAYYPPFLKTLAEREFNSGMAEVIKHGVINGGKLHDFLGEVSAQELRNSDEKITQLCQLASEVKVNVVEQDERESGLRKKLNLGHTIGHAIEATSNFTHGECVAIGMALAAKIAVKKGVATQELTAEIIHLCEHFNLPTRTKVQPKLWLEKIIKDKKRSAQRIDFLLPHSFGDVRITPMEISELEQHLNDLTHE